MGLDINLNTSKIDISEDDGLNVDLYKDIIDISDDEADDIIIEITGLKSISKFIGLEDTPLYYDNGKFFKVENNKIIYTDIEWKDISGNLEDAPELVSLIEKLIEEYNKEIINRYINIHNNSRTAHPYIQDIIQENYNTLDAKIDNTKEELSQDISNLNNALNQEISNRETADSELSESIQQETLARIEADTTLQNNINSVASDLSDEISARESADTTLSNSISDLSDGLIQEITDRQTADTGLQSQITSNYNTLDSKIDNVESSLNDLSDTVDANDTAINNKVDNINNTLTNSISTLSDTVSSNYTTLDNKIDSVEGALADSITALDNKYDNITSGLDDKIDDVDDTLTTHISDNSNPHNVTKTQVGLSNVDNTSDLDKPISTATQTALDGINDSLTSHTSNTNNPHNVTKTQIGLGNVDNTSDLNKPISTATQTALDGKVPNTRTVNNKPLSSDIVLDYSDVNALPDTTTINDLTTTAQQNALNSGIDSTLTQQIATNQNNISNLSSTVSSNYTTLDNRITSEVNTLNSSISDEETARINADNGLQSQIDAITSASDVTDIVGTYAELQAYDTTSLPDKSIIKVLQDEGRNDETTYYRWVITNGTGAWVLIGEEGPYYTKSEADGRFVNQTTTVNNKALSSNITLTASDVGALPDNTVIGDGTLTIQKNGTTIDTFTANTTSNKTINITVPTDTQDLTNGAGYITNSALNGYATENFVLNQGYITGITSTDVTTALGYVPYNSTNPSGYTTNVGTVTSVNNTQPDANGNVTLVIPDTATWGNISGTLSNQTDLQNALNSKYDASNPAGYITSADLPTNYVTTDTVQNISGRKTFLGEKAIYFKQNTTSDKLGFTLYNTSNAEVGGLEYRPNTINGNALLALNCPQSGSNYVGFRYWSGINIVAPRPTTNGNYFIPVNITDGTNTVTANNNGTLNISSLLPDVSDMATQTWVTNQGYTTNVGTVTSVNNTQPDASGNVTLTIPDTATWGNITGTLSDQTDLQTALDSKLQNTARGSNSLNILGNATNYAGSISIGYYSYVPSSDAIAIGYNTQAKSQNSMAIGGDGTTVGTGSNYSIALGIGASVDNSKTRAIQIGEGTNSNRQTLQIGFGTNYNYTLLDGTTGLIPDARLSTNIARTSQIPDVSNFVTNTSLATTLQDYVLSSDLSTTLTNYVTSSSLTTVLTDYQPLLESGTNIKTINNQSLLGSGNIDIQGGVSMTYDSTTETLTFA